MVKYSMGTYGDEPCRFIDKGIGDRKEEPFPAYHLSTNILSKTTVRIDRRRKGGRCSEGSRINCPGRTYIGANYIYIYIFTLYLGLITLEIVIKYINSLRGVLKSGGIPDRNPYRRTDAGLRRTGRAWSTAAIIWDNQIYTP